VTNFNNSYRRDGVLVPPRSNISIARDANTIRDILDLSYKPYFPIVQFYETLSYICEGADFEVKFMHEMGEDHGRTFPDKALIWIREDVYENAYRGEARDRFTMCHELGHLIMHRNIAFSRIDPRNPPKGYCNSEWQADKFASYLMMPDHLLQNYDSKDHVMRDFGVSFSAATARQADMKKI